MKKKEDKLPERMTLEEAAAEAERRAGISRRAFLSAAGAAAAGAALAGTAQASEKADSSAAADGTTTGDAPVTDELPIPEPKAPAQTEYETDLLVLGGGWGGITAANYASEQGLNVLLVDKGTPGYSGYMPWSHTYKWVDTDIEDPQPYIDAIYSDSDYTANPEIMKLWTERSKEVAEKHHEWGFLNDWKDWDWQSGDPQKAKIDNPTEDRHYYYAKSLEDHNVQVVPRTMIVDIFEDNGRVTGALGMDVDSGTLITFKAKAVIMAMGAGSLKPTGFPTGDNTFDGQAIAYRHGLTIAGKEFPDFHGSPSYAPGSVYWTWGNQYLESNILCGGVQLPPTLVQAVFSCIQDGTPRVPYGTPGMTPPEGMLGSEQAGIPDDGLREGAHTTIPMGMQNSLGGCVGMSIHKTEGVWSGWDKIDGSTEIAGLWVVGDNFASMMSGAVYCSGEGTSSNMSGVEAMESVEAAMNYLPTAGEGEIDQDVVDTWQAKLDNLLQTPNGFNPTWARDVLHATLAPYWVYWTKTEPILQGALGSVEFMRDNIAPRLCANDAHELRECLEFENRVLSAEMTLRGSLERKESRGTHYRADYPYRDDANFLCHFGYKQAEDGSMQVVRIDYPDEWKGDLTEDYQHRYPTRYPGETEALGLDPANEPAAEGHDWSQQIKGDESSEASAQ